MTRLVIFDLDGTLLDTIDDLAASTNYALRRNGYPEHELAAYRYFVGNGVAKLIERCPKRKRARRTSKGCAATSSNITRNIAPT